MELYFQTQDGEFSLAQPTMVCEAAAKFYQDTVCGEHLNRPELIAPYLRVLIKDARIEQFIVVFLDARNRVIASQVMFTGTVNQTAVYPREVVRSALLNNACSVIVSHNHPSGVCEPSPSDRALTESLDAALATVSIRLLDHLIISATQCYSFTKAATL